MDFLTRLRTFVAISHAGSISKAARALRISVPMASRHLQSLESELDVELVRRTTHHLQLTSAGVELVGRARRLLDDVEDARAAVRPGQLVRGTLVLSMPVSLGIAQVSPLIPPLLRKHPRLTVELRFDDRVVDLLSENIDIAIRAGVAPPDSSSFVARRLQTFERTLCAAPSFVRKHKLKDPRSLEAVSCLIQGSGPGRWRLTTAEGIVEVLVDGPLRTSNIFALRDAAIAGLGVAQLPVEMIAEPLRQKQLVRVLEAAAPPPGAIYAIYHHNARRSSAIQAVLDHLAGQLGAPP